MPFDIRAHERALGDDLQPLVACAVEREADQLAGDAMPLDLGRHGGVGKDDRIAFPLIGGESAMPVDGELKLLLGPVITYVLHQSPFIPRWR